MFVVVREHAQGLGTLAGYMSRLTDWAKKLKLTLHVVPFSRLDYQHGGHFTAVYQRPKVMKALIRKAKCVVSIGRFHPLVMAMSTLTPCVYIDPHNYELDKCTELRRQFPTLPYFHEIDDVVMPERPVECNPDGQRQAVERMAAFIVDIFGGP